MTLHLVRLLDERGEYYEDVLLSRVPSVGEYIEIPELGKQARFVVTAVLHRAALHFDNSSPYAAAVKIAGAPVEYDTWG